MEKSVSDEFDICPKCGQKLLKGAMKCMACNTVLKTEDEQKEMIRKFMEPRKRGFTPAGLRKIIIYLVVFGVIYYVYSEEIRAVISYITRAVASR